MDDTTRYINFIKNYNDELKKKGSDWLNSKELGKVLIDTARKNNSKKLLPVNRVLNEETKLQTIILHKPDGVYDMHRGLGDDKTIYITEHGNPDNVILWCTQELWDKIFGK